MMQHASERRGEVGFLEYLSSRVSQPNPRPARPLNHQKTGHNDEKSSRLEPVLSGHERRSALMAK